MSTTPSPSERVASKGESLGNLSVDSVTIFAFFLLFIPTLIIYFKRKCYEIFYSCTGKCIKDNNSDGQTKQQREESAKAKRFFYILIHSLLLFYVFRIIHEAVTVAQHIFEYQGNTYVFEIIKQVRRMLDYISIEWYLFTYSCILPIWSKVCLVWMSSKQNKKRVQRGAYVVVVLCNLFVCAALLPLVIFCFIALCSPSTYSEDTRKKVMYGASLPIGILSLLGVTLTTFVAAIAIVKMIRETNKNQIEDSEAFQAQKQTIIKISIAVVALGICVIVRIIGVAIYAINIPSYVTYPLIKAIPDGLFAVCVCLLFWPYRLPILSQPIKFIKTEFKYVKVELEKKKNNHLNNLNRNNEMERLGSTSDISSTSASLNAPNFESSPPLSDEKEMIQV
ncbi:hypothetical protein ABK040_014317 [Willaertia magna]